jgi:hypothetical protein
VISKTQIPVELMAVSRVCSMNAGSIPYWVISTWSATPSGSVK